MQMADTQQLQHNNPNIGCMRPSGTGEHLAE